MYSLMDTANTTYIILNYKLHNSVVKDRQFCSNGKGGVKMVPNCLLVQDAIIVIIATDRHQGVSGLMKCDCLTLATSMMYGL